MSRFVVFVALISINQLAESATQSFGQSFASSSVVKPNGQVISSSIYTDSKGNRVVNGPALKIPQLHNDLLPPFSPGEIAKPFVLPFQPFQPLVPVIPAFKPTVSPITTTRSTVKTTTRTTIRPSATPTTTRAAATFNRVTSAVKPARIAADPNAVREGQYVPDNSGAYVHDVTAGAYFHDKNAGAWVPDDRGKYRRQ